MKKIYIYYFSGSGNTKVIVDSVSNKLESKEYKVDLFPLEKGFKAPEDKTAKIIFAFPANSQAVSPLVWSFFKSLPEVKGIKAYILVTLNESVHIAAPILKLLKKKGYIPKGSCMISMPQCMLELPIDEIKDAERNAKALAKVNGFVDNIVYNKDFFDTEYQGSKFVSFLSRCTVLPWFFMRKMFKFEVDTKKCTNCGLCLKQCPVGNIKQEGYPVHGNKCDFCIRCAANCPNKAVFAKGNEKILIRQPVTKVSDLRIS